MSREAEERQKLESKFISIRRSIQRLSESQIDKLELYPHRDRGFSRNAGNTSRGPGIRLRGSNE